ncbi:MAG: Rieske (2Fe-2S) protein [Frankiales bacterium]|nr:Rieske (2Fe-2S) protein [Frankiales bacterium]
MSVPPLTRRSLLSGSAFAAVGGIAGFVLARHSSAAEAKPDTSAANAYGPGSGSAAGHVTVVTGVDRVPPGGTVLAAGLLVTRDSAGAVHAVSATCTHQGCSVAKPVAGVVTCPCHGSRFNAVTGAVINGPANHPLPAVPVRVVGTQIVRG